MINRKDQKDLKTSINAYTNYDHLLQMELRSAVSIRLMIEGLLVRVSPPGELLCCVLEQDTLGLLWYGKIRVTYL